MYDLGSTGLSIRACVTARATCGLPLALTCPPKKLLASDCDTPLATSNRTPCDQIRSRSSGGASASVTLVTEYWGMGDGELSSGLCFANPEITGSVSSGFCFDNPEITKSVFSGLASGFAFAFCGLPPDLPFVRALSALSCARTISASARFWCQPSSIRVKNSARTVSTAEISSFALARTMRATAFVSAGSGASRM